MSKVQGALKAIVPAGLTLVATLAYSLQNGKFDKVAAVGAAVGLIGSAVTYFVPNAAPEVEAVEAAFAPVSAGHPDPEPAPVLATPAPVSPQVVPLPPNSAQAPVPPTPPAA